MATNPMEITKMSNSSEGMKCFHKIGLSTEKAMELINLLDQFIEKDLKAEDILINISKYCQTPAELAYISMIYGLKIEEEASDDDIIDDTFDSFLKNINQDTMEKFLKEFAQNEVKGGNPSVKMFSFDPKDIDKLEEFLKINKI